MINLVSLSAYIAWAYINEKEISNLRGVARRKLLRAIDPRSFFGVFPLEKERSD